MQHIDATPAFTKKPIRIVSLVPSQTELLYDLGLEAFVAGITKFCIHPAAWLSDKKIVGGTKNVHVEKIKALNPDLILANKEENVQQQVEVLAEFAPVWVSDVQHLHDAISMIGAVGTMTHTVDKADEVIKKITDGFQSLTIKQNTKGIRLKKKVAYLIWQNPIITIGNDTFIHHMLELAGFENVFANRQRYPETSIEELRTLLRQSGNEDASLMLSSEPFPFQEKHVGSYQETLPGVQVKLVDGTFFSWYGSRLQSAPAYFKTLWDI